MTIVDPDTTPADETAPDPITPTPEAEPTAEPEIAEADGMLAAIAADESVKEGAAKTEAVQPDTAATPEAVDPAADPDVETEIAELKLKEKGATRFRELVARDKDAAPIREAMEKAGVTDIASLERQFTLASQGKELIDTVMGTGATPDQFGMTLEYMGAINAAMSGDPAAGERAWAMFMAEGASLAKALGREFAGVHDPLTEHADLQADVEAGDLTRARALEIASVRQREVTRSAAAESRQQAAQQANAQAQQTAAEAQARTDLNALGDELDAADPNFRAKLPQLLELRDLVRKAFPPEQWVGELRARYARIPAPVAATPKLPTPGPVRANGPMPTMASTFDDPMEAMLAGIAAAS